MARQHLWRCDLGGTAPADPGECVLALLLLSDVQVVDTVSPARCEWVELLADEPRWQPLLHMHRPYEALTHWVLAAHVAAARRAPQAPCSGRPYDLALFLGDNIDNAQHNELDAFLAIVAGGSCRLDARGGVHQASGATPQNPWPWWCPEDGVPDLWKARGYPVVPDFVARAGAEVVSPGLGFPWAAVPGNHDLMRQGTALPTPEIERIACGGRKALFRPQGFDPADPLTLFVDDPAAFSRGAGRDVPALVSRRALDMQAWLAALVARGACGLDADHVARRCADTVIDHGPIRLVLLDTNHPAGDYEGSIGVQQLAWLERQLHETAQHSGRVAVVASHHGASSLTNTRGADPERRHAAALTELLQRHACVIAWLSGHRHRHQVTAHPGANGGFWEIATGSLIDWPAQGRAVEFVRHAGGRWSVRCSLIDHGAAHGELAQLHHELARRFAGPLCGRMQGAAGDGDVSLLR